MLFYKNLIGCDYIFIAPLLCSEDQDEYRCSDDQCIQFRKRCDGDRDCRNGEDERDCSKFKRFYKIAKCWCVICSEFVSQMRQEIYNEKLQKSKLVKQ